MKIGYCKICGAEIDNNYLDTYDVMEGSVLVCRGLCKKLYEQQEKDKENAERAANRARAQEKEAAEQAAAQAGIEARRVADEFAEQRRQQALDSKAQALGYANYEEYREARRQSVRDAVDEEAAELIQESNEVIDQIAKYEDFPAPTAKDIRKLAETISKNYDKLPQNFAANAESLFHVSKYGLESGKLDLSKGDAENLFGTFFELVQFHIEEKELKKENEEIKVTRKVTVCTGADIYTNDVIEFLMANKEGIEDILDPLLKKCEKSNSKSESISSIVLSGFSVASAFACVKFFGKYGFSTTDAYGSLGGWFLAWFSFIFAIAAAGYRKTRIESLIVSFVLPIALYFVCAPICTTTAFSYFRFESLFYGEIFEIRHAFSAYTLNMAFFASLLAIIPSVKNFKKKKFSVGTKLSNADMAKASDKATTDRTGSVTVGLGTVAILLMFLANIFSINDALTNDGVPNANRDGQYFWAAVFTIASMLAPIFAFTTGKSFQKRPSVHIMLFIELISFGLWSIPYFRYDGGDHFVTGGASLVVAFLALIALIVNFIWSFSMSGLTRKTKINTEKK